MEAILWGVVISLKFLEITLASINYTKIKSLGSFSQWNDLVKSTLNSRSQNELKIGRERINAQWKLACRKIGNDKLWKEKKMLKKKFDLNNTKNKNN